MPLNDTCLDYDNMIIDAQFRHLVVEEGRTKITEISLPEYNNIIMQATITAHVVTLEEYQQLVNSSHTVCTMGLNDVLRETFNETQQLSDLDQAEGKSCRYTSSSYVLDTNH